MLFNSIHFLIFFCLLAGTVFLLPRGYRWILVLLASYYFYASWNAAYLILILITSATTYGCALGLSAARRERVKTAYLASACIINFGILFGFKYFNFFSTSVAAGLGFFHLDVDAPLLDVLLPVGISFYTFQAIGYVIDVYRGDTPPEKHIGIFALYISFFPQLVAGPIERSRNLLPQFYSRLTFDYEKAVQSAALMLWGFFQKIVIADRLALYVNDIFAEPSACDSLQVMTAAYFFSFQIYCDFAGYSNIAIGAAGIFGIDLMNNFNRPYFSGSIREFWRRWHISLSSWFRDYLYIPLGGNRTTDGRLIFNILVVFLLCGLWHGAAWNFVIWGGLHGLMLCGYTLLKNRYDLWNRISLPPVFNVVATFHLVTLAWIFFRARTFSQAADFFSTLFAFRLDSWDITRNTGFSDWEFTLSLFFIAILMVIEMTQNKWERFSDFWVAQRTAARWMLSYFLFFSILIFGMFQMTEFIYFQF